MTDSNSTPRPPRRLDPEGHEELLRYLLRPPLAQRFELQKDGLVRIVVKRT